MGRLRGIIHGLYVLGRLIVLSVSVLGPLILSLIVEHAHPVHRQRLGVRRRLQRERADHRRLRLGRRRSVPYLDPDTRR